MSAPLEREPLSFGAYVTIVIAALGGVWATIELISLLPWISRQLASWMVYVSLILVVAPSALAQHRRRSRP